MPSGTFTHTTVIDRAPAEVWNELMKSETWGNIGPVDDVWDPTHDAAGVLTGYRWSTNVANRKFVGTAAVVDHEAPSRYVIDLDAGEMAGKISIDLVGGNPSTELTVELEFRTKGMLSSMFFPLIRDAIAKGFPDQIEGFADSLA